MSPILLAMLWKHSLGLYDETGLDPHALCHAHVELLLRGLLKRGESLYSETESSGTAITGNPGQLGFGVLRQNALEASNVEPVSELIELITTQRAFELNSQVVQAGDQVMQLVANLRRM